MARIMAKPVALLLMCFISLTPERAQRRLLADAAEAGTVVPMNQLSGDGEYTHFYVANLTIGTPPQPVSAIVELTGQFVWTQCAPCSRCFPQELPLFAPAASATFRREPCGTALCESIPTRNCSVDVCVFTVDDGAGAGAVSTDALAIGTARLGRFAFACLVARDVKTLGGPSGAVGLGRTPWSLVAQMNATAFSYCLVPYGLKKSSALFLGAAAKLPGGKGSSTPLVKTAPGDDLSSLYMLRLESIKAGETVIPAPANGSTVVAETAVPFSFLVDGAYQLLKKAVAAQVGQASAAPPPRGSPFDLCFQLAKTQLTAGDLVFTFQGGAAMTLPPANYLMDVGNGTFCLAMQSAAKLKTEPATEVSILGSFQQQNIHMLFDLDKQTLSFEPADCRALS